MATFVFNDFHVLSTAEKYRWMVQLIIPRPIAWVSSLNADGVINLAPFSFFNGVCSNPPTLALSITRKRDGSKKDTLLNIERSREFVVNTSTWAEADRINRTSATLPHDVSEVLEAGCSTLASRFVKPPRIAESFAQFECELDRVVEIGDGTPGSASLVLGRILCVHVDERILVNGRVNPELMNPASRLGGKFWGSLGELRELPRLD